MIPAMFVLDELSVMAGNDVIPDLNLVVSAGANADDIAREFVSFLLSTLDLEADLGHGRFFEE